MLQVRGEDDSGNVTLAGEWTEGPAIAKHIRCKSKSKATIVDKGKGPSTQGEEFADEYSTNIGRRSIYNFKLIFFAELHFC